LQKDGVIRFEALEEAERLSSKIVRILAQYRVEELPFDLSDKGPIAETRLIRKSRSRIYDNNVTLEARETLRFANEVLTSLSKITHVDFEVVSALCLKMSDARESFALGTVDEGGIDVFGRIDIGARLAIAKGLLETNILRTPKGILFLGQCKQWSGNVGRPDIQGFREAVTECMSKYKGNDHPPSHRIDENYYDEWEFCIPFFITASAFSYPAAAAASSRNILTVSGRRLAEFICSRQVGFERDNNRLVFSESKLVEWIQLHRSEVRYSPPIRSAI
jgi:hypothetical protein